MTKNKGEAGSGFPTCELIFLPSPKKERKKVVVVLRQRESLQHQSSEFS